MRIKRIRWLLAIFVAMFFANNVAAAARACVLPFMSEDHAAIQTLDARGIEHLCPDADEATRCLAHCTQGLKSGEQGLSADVPLPAFAPGPALLYFSSPPGQSATVIAAAPAFVGPPLTILFRNLRN